MRALLAAVLVLAALTPAAAAACPAKRGATVLARSASAVVVETRLHVDGHDYTGIVWACRAREGRWWRLDRTAVAFPGYSRTVFQVRLAGTRVAYAWEDGDARQDIATGVDAWDLRTRRRVTRVASDGLWASIARVVLAPSGAVAFSVSEWLFEGEPPAPRRHRRVYRAKGTRATVLDDDLGIRLNSLELAGARLTWRWAGRVRRAELR